MTVAACLKRSRSCASLPSDDKPSRVVRRRLAETTTTTGGVTKRPRVRKPSSPSSIRPWMSYSRRFQNKHDSSRGSFVSPSSPFGAQVEEDESQDDADDELELDELEADLLPSSPSRRDTSSASSVHASLDSEEVEYGVPLLAQFAGKGTGLEKFARSLPSDNDDMTNGPVQMFRDYKLDIKTFNQSNKCVPSSLGRGLAPSFLTPRKISSTTSRGELTEDDSGNENASDILSEIEEENRLYYAEQQQQKKGDRYKVLEASNQSARRLLPSVSDVTTSLGMLESPIMTRAVPQMFMVKPPPPMIPSSPGQVEEEIERELLNDVGQDAEMDVDEQEQAKVLSMMFSDVDEQDTSDDMMELSAEDFTRIHHQSRMQQLTAPQHPRFSSFAGNRSRAVLYRARHLSDIVAGLGWSHGMKFARLVAVKRRRGCLSRSPWSQTSMTGVPSWVSTEFMIQQKQIRNHRNEVLQRYRQRTLSQMDASAVLDQWCHVMAQLEPFKSWMMSRIPGGLSERMMAALSSVLEQEAREREEWLVDSSLPLCTFDHSYYGPTESAISHTRTRTWTDDRHLESYEAMYPEFLPRYMNRLAETEARFAQLREWQTVDARWERRFERQRERERETAELQARRLAAAAMEARQQRRQVERQRAREEADQRAREQREVEAYEALLRQVQIAQWQGEAQERSVEEAVPATVPPPLYMPPDQASTTPGPQSPPQAPSQAEEEEEEETVEHQEALPTTPPRPCQTLPDYSRIVYGHLSPPPPPPYNAQTGFELVQIDDLLLEPEHPQDDQDDDIDRLLEGFDSAAADDDDDDDLESVGPIRGNWDLQDESHDHQHVAVRGDEPIQQASHEHAPRILTLEEMQAEQRLYEQAEQDVHEDRRASRCTIM